MLPCEVVRDLHQQYAAGTLDRDTRASVEKHLAQCPACRAQYEKGHQVGAVKNPRYRLTFVAAGMTVLLFAAGAVAGGVESRFHPFWQDAAYTAVQSAFVPVGQAVTIDGVAVTIDRLLMDRVRTLVFFTTDSKLPANVNYELALRDDAGGSYSYSLVQNRGSYWQAESSAVPLEATSLEITLTSSATGHAGTVHVNLPAGAAAHGKTVFPQGAVGRWGPFRVRVTSVSYGVTDTMVEMVAEPQQPLPGIGIGFQPGAFAVWWENDYTQLTAGAASWPVVQLAAAQSSYRSPWTQSLEAGEKPRYTQTQERNIPFPLTLVASSGAYSFPDPAGMAAELRSLPDHALYLQYPFHAVLASGQAFTISSPEMYLIEPVRARVVIPRKDNESVIPVHREFRVGGYTAVIEAVNVVGPGRMVVIYHFEDANRQLVPGRALWIVAPAVGASDLAYVSGDTYVAQSFSGRPVEVPSGPIELWIVGVGHKFAGDSIQVIPPAGG